MPNSPKRASPTQPNDLPPVRAKREELANGLRLITLPMPEARTAALTVHVRIGSRYETARDNGISHFLEHMLHRGTRRHPSAHAQALAFEQLGGTLSAATYVDHGVLALTVPPSAVLPALELLYEVCAEPVYDAIDVERGIVREEILESLDARGRSVSADDMLRRAAFPAHPLGQPIAGTLQTLERFSVPRLARHHSRFYTSRLVVTAAGKLPERELSRFARARLSFPRGAAPLRRAPRPPRGPRIEHLRDSSSQTAMRLGFRAPGERDRHAAAAELLLRVIDDGSSTRLYHRICDERGLCYDVSALYESYEDAGLFDIAAETSHDNAVEVGREILRMLRELRESGPTAAELEKAKQRLRWQVDAMHESPSELASFYGFGELARLYRTPRERLERLEAVTLSATRRAAEQIFRPEALSLVTVGELTRAQQGALARAVRDFA